MRDDAGTLLVTLSSDGRWSTVREVEELRLLQKVFVRTPISSGQWKVTNGTLTLQCLTSIHANRINQQMPFAIRSVSERDFIFIDPMGRLGKATRVR